MEMILNVLGVTSYIVFMTSPLLKRFEFQNATVSKNRIVLSFLFLVGCGLLENIYILFNNINVEGYFLVATGLNAFVLLSYIIFPKKIMYFINSLYCWWAILGLYQFFISEKLSLLQTFIYFVVILISYIPIIYYYKRLR